jgi:hypothetical protein
MYASRCASVSAAEAHWPASGMQPDRSNPRESRRDFRFKRLVRLARPFGEIETTNIAEDHGDVPQPQAADRT